MTCQACQCNGMVFAKVPSQSKMRPRGCASGTLDFRSFMFIVCSAAYGVPALAGLALDIEWFETATLTPRRLKPGLHTRATPCLLSKGSLIRFPIKYSGSTPQVFLPNR